MKKLFIASAFIFVSLIGLAQTETIRGKQYELVGKVNGEIISTPFCGSFAWATVVEFEILQYSDFDYKSKSIGVIFTCLADNANGFLEVGKTYKLTVVDQNQAEFSWTIPNYGDLSKFNLKNDLYVLEREKLD